jgi:hypothetical protein
MMVEYVNEIVVAYDMVLSELSDGFSIAKKKKNPARISASPGADDLFVVDDDAEKLSKEGSTTFHNLVAKTLYVSKPAH